MIGYTLKNYRGKNVNDVPGYCCVEENGLFYLSIIGLTRPLYRFQVQGLHPWIDDDIVGFKWVPEMEKECEKYRIPNEQIPAELKKLSDQGYAQGGLNQQEQSRFTCLARLYQPGWHWTPQIEVGAPGESIVNARVRMELVDGPELLEVIKRADREGLASKEALIQEAMKNGAPYEIDWSSLVIESIAGELTDDPDVPDEKVEQEKRRHRQNLRRYAYILQ